jgi:hypothetical protein
MLRLKLLLEQKGFFGLTDIAWEGESAGDGDGPAACRKQK